MTRGKGLFRFLSTTLLLLLGARPELSGAITQTINYQGFLTDKATGLPVDSPKDMRLIIYDSATGGTSRFTETRCAGGDGPVTLYKGRYEVQIGSKTAGGIPASVFTDYPALWLEVQISPAGGCAGFESLLPRVRLQAAPYAFNALTASTATANVLRSGDSMSGPATVYSTATITGQDSLGYSLKLSAGLSMSAGTVNAKYFVGDGSRLSDVLSSDPTKVARTGDSMSGPLTVYSTLTVTGNAFSIGVSTLAVSYGKVGIGTTNPGYTLDVSGDIHASGNLKAGLTTSSINSCTSASYCYVACPSGYVIYGNCFSSGAGNLIASMAASQATLCYGYMAGGTSATGWCCATNGTGTIYVSVTCARLGGVTVRGYRTNRDTTSSGRRPSGMPR